MILPILTGNSWRNIVRRIPEGCVLALTGEGGSQSTIPDWSGSGNNGTITGATWQKIPSDLPILYFAADDFINIDVAVNDISSATAGTIEGWFKLPDATPAATSILIGFGDTNADEYISFFIDTAGKLATTCTDASVNAWRVITDAAAVADNTWAHLAVAQNGTVPVLYVNGVAVAQTFTVEVDKTKWFAACGGIDNGRIGCINYNSAGNAAFLTSSAVLTRIYTRALPATELLSHCKQERPLFGV